jgi:hypothetical protein
LMMNDLNVKTMFVAIVFVSIGTGCGVFAPSPDIRLKCIDKDEPAEVKYYCTNKKGCTNFEVGDKLLCSWILESDELHEDEFDTEGEALLGGACVEGDPAKGYPPTACNGPSSGGGDGDGGGGGGDADADSSDTNATPTGGDPTEGQEKTRYLCSLRSEIKCADIDIDNALEAVVGEDPYPADTALDACWAPVEPDSLPAKKIAYCIDVVSQNDALGYCEANCNVFNEYIVRECAKKGCTVITPVDCILANAVDTLEPPDEAADNSMTWTCDNDTGMLPTWDGESALTLFDGVGSMVLNGGTFSGVRGIGGYLGFTISNCPSNSTACTITIDAFESLSRHLEGWYSDAAGGGGDYEFDRVGFRSRTSFSGTWNPLRGSISFPDTSVEAEVWGGHGYIDGAGMWAGSQTMTITQISGYLASAEDPLTLNFTFNWDDGAAFISVTSVPN